MNLNVYEGTKAVRKVKSLEDESQGTNLGVLPFGVSVLLSKNHVEFAVTLEAKKSNNESVWLGFYFSSSFLKFQKIFKKSNGPSLDNLGFENISAIIHKNLVTKFEDPYSCPLYITGTNDTRAYWTIFTNNSVIGHIPLHRSDSFHSLQSYPVLYLENDIQIVLGTDLDRNQLFPSYSKVDSLYSTTLRNIDTTFSQNKWSATVIPLIKDDDSTNNNNSNTVTGSNTSPSVSSDSLNSSSNSVGTGATGSTSNTSKFDLYAKQLLSKNQFDLEKLSRWFIKKFNSTTSPLTFAYGVSMYRKSNSKTMDLLTLKTLLTGKTYIVNLLHTFRLIPSLDYFKDTDVQKNFENDNIAQYTQKFLELEKDCQTIKVLFPTSSISIYNPFFDKYIKKTYKFYSPLTLESSFLSSNQNLSSSTGGNNNTNSTTTTTTPTTTTTTTSVSQQQSKNNTTTTTIVDPISVSSSSIPSPSSSSSTSSTTPFVSISTSESNENILDKLKNLDKKIKIERSSVHNNNNIQHREKEQQPQHRDNNNHIDTDKLALVVAKLLKEKHLVV